jgi:hypothetical protein
VRRLTRARCCKVQARRPIDPAAAPDAATEGSAMTMNVTIGPLLALIAGILILFRPRLLNYIVAIYLILVGVLGLFGSGNLRL